MVNNILTQRFNFFEITPYKNYSTLSSKPEQNKAARIELETTGIDRLSLFLEELGGVADMKESHMLYLHNKKEAKKKNTKYFYCDNNLPDEKIRLFPLGTFYTQNERHLKRHFGNPFSSVKTTIHERTINMSDDKISIRFSRFEKTRSVNCKYFKKHSYSMGVSMDLKTGNIVIYQGEKKLIKIRQNSFKFLIEVLTNFLRKTRDCVGYFMFGNQTKDLDINKKYLEAFNDDEFNKTLFHVISSKSPEFNSAYPNDEKGIVNFTYNGFMRLFVKVNNIKVPNDYKDLMLNWYPTKQFLKKNDNKLIVSVLDRIGLKSKSIIKLIHKNPKIDISKLTLLGKYFGYRNVHKYVHNLSPQYFSNDWKLFDEQANLESMYSVLNERFEYDIKDSERSLLLKMMNEFFNYDTITESTVKSQIRQFNDHLDLINRIRRHIPEMEIRCHNLKDFHKEHIEFSKIERSIKKGYSIEYKFEDKLVKTIENPIVFDDITYYPVLLKIDAEYTEEGAHMHHCVATYADRENSIIVSLREGSTVGHERVTCEFNLQKHLVQAKYFCNAQPPDRFENVIDKLGHKIHFYSGSIKSISKEKIPLVINGKTIKIEERTDDSIFNLLFDRNDF
jgi:hypothetical protein